MKKVFINILTAIILGYLAIFFNGEMYAHSWGAFVIPSLVIMYILYTWLMKTLVDKFEFNGIKIFLVGSSIGLLLETFYSKSIFINPLLFGVNWLSVLVQALYWGMAALMPLYLYKQYKNKRILKENKLLDLSALTYLIAQLLINSYIYYPDTIILWIVSGTPLALILLITALKQKDIIKT